MRPSGRARREGTVGTVSTTQARALVHAGQGLNLEWLLATAQSWRECVEEALVWLGGPAAPGG